MTAARSAGTPDAAVPDDDARAAADVATRADGPDPTSPLQRFVDRAADGPHATAHAEALRKARPSASPADLVALLESRYRRRVRLVSTLIGVTAAVPGVGTGVAALLTAGNVVAYLRVSTTFIGAVAHVHGIPLDDVERRRTLLLTSLLGEDAARAVGGSPGAGGLLQGRALLTRLPLSTVRGVNRGLSRRLVRLAGARGGAMLLGRLVPFGVGAVVGWVLGGRLATQVIDGTRDAFGPPPSTPTSA